MPNPGDEHAAGDVPPEAEMMPKMLRDLHEPTCPLSDLPYDRTDPLSLPGCTCSQGAERRAAASAWEADRARMETAERDRFEQGKCIEALEKERDEWENATQYALEHYPEDVFPTESTSQDAKAGTFARRLTSWLLDPVERKKWAALAAEKKP